MRHIFVRKIRVALLGASVLSPLCFAPLGAGALAAGAHADAPPQQDSAAAPDTQADSEEPIIVEGQRWKYNLDTRYSHTLPEVDGAMLTVTKKTSVIKLDQQPVIIDNNQRALFSRIPGVFISEQQTPDQLNLSYRGIGNPQESEFVLVMQDGIPLLSDWIGFPTLVYIPAPQSISSVQLIRGGSGLLYGPEPQPVVNFVSRTPDPDHAFTARTEQTGGSDALFSSYNEVSGTSGAWSYLADYHHRQSDGRRVNGDYALNSGDIRIGYAFDDSHKLTVDVHTYAVSSGDAGRMSFTQWKADLDQTTTPNNHTWVNRYTGVVTYEGALGARGLVVGKAWAGRQNLDQRTSRNIVPPATPTSSTLSIEQYTYTGLDVRYRRQWARGNAFTIGVTGYRSKAPWQRYWYSLPGTITVSRDDRSGAVNLDQDRKTLYGAIFAENVFRWGIFHVVPSVRYEFEQLDIGEHVVPGARPLVDRTYKKDLPLFGIGAGFDFGHGNETYFNVSQGYRPLRYLDVASPFGNTNTTLNNPDPTKSLSYEAGAHGWPLKGVYYDASVFQVSVKDRIESQAVTSTPDPTDSINVNTGNTRSRGFEGELHVDLLRFTKNAPDTEHLELYGNISLLDADFTASINGLTGATPAFAPHVLARAGVIWRDENHYKLAFNMQSSASSYWQDSNQPFGAKGDANYLPAKVPAYTVLDISGDYHITKHLELIGGVANLTNHTYYSRVFLNTLEPASGRTFYVGLAADL